MNQLLSGVKGLFFVVAVAAAGPLLHWATVGSLAALTADDLDSMATAAAGAIAWTAYTWLVVATAATALERVPGVAGRAAGAVAESITSAGSRALLRSALGLAVTAPLTIGMAHAATPGGGPAHTVQQPWQQVEKPSSVTIGSPVGTTGWHRRGQVEPASTVRISDPAGQPRVVVPDRPTTGAATRYTEIPTTDRGQPGSHGRVTEPGTSPHRAVVRPGDSLWSIAAAELGADATDARIAVRWPRWYAANQHSIGADPDLIRPGQVLRTPPSERSDQSSHHQPTKGN
jgi:nucleoid-associated protein YgaU